VWDLESAVADAMRVDSGVSVSLRDGARHEHHADADGWHIAMSVGGATSSIDLGGVVERPSVQPTSAPAPESRAAPIHIPSGDHAQSSARPLTFALEGAHYRRSEQSWTEAGEPTATVSIATVGDELVLAIDVAKSDVHFAPACDWNPLDNEHPDTNSDGIQLHVAIPPDDLSAPDREITWLLVPEPNGERVRISARPEASSALLVASWQRTDHGYAIRCALPLASLGIRGGVPFLLGLIVNETAPDRERRRGQLVLGGSPGEFVYLRGDRLPREHHLAFIIADA
jgi:hypothetical protein